MNLIKTLEPNVTGRDFVIGDLHGSFDVLVNLLFNLNFDPNADRLISVGDLVDRGPKSCECLELLLEPWFHAVRGNHEQMMLNALNDQPGWVENWIRNGGSWILDLETREKVNQLIDIVNELPYLITVKQPNGKKFHVLHAELPPGAQVTDEMLEDEDVVQKLVKSTPDRESFLWTRFLFSPFAYQNLSNVNKIARTAKYMFGKSNPFNENLSHIISGHSIMHRPMTLLGQTNIDTGAFTSSTTSWGALTCVELGSWTFYQGTENEFREVKPLVVNMEDLNVKETDETN